MLEICEAYGCKWDIQFNPQKSQLLTITLSTAISLSQTELYNGVPMLNILELLFVMQMFSPPILADRKASSLAVLTVYCL